MIKKLITFTTAAFLSVMPTIGYTASSSEFRNIPERNITLTTEAPAQPQEAGTPSTSKEQSSAPKIQTVPSKDRYIVKEDPGGSVSEFIQALQYAKTKGYKFKIDGYCASACTLILAKPLKLDVCITPKASFMFHQPFAMDGYGRIYHSIPFVAGAQAMWDNLFYSNYPDWVKKLIDANGGVPNVYKGAKPSDMFVVKYDTMKTDLPTCE